MENKSSFSFKSVPSSIASAISPFSCEGLLNCYVPQRGTFAIRNASRYDIKAESREDYFRVSHFNDTKFSANGIHVVNGTSKVDYPGCFGYNKRFIRDNSTLDREEIMLLVTKECIDRSSLNREKIQRIRNFDFCDCQLSLIYNMLVTWFMLDLKQAQSSPGHFVVRKTLEDEVPDVEDGIWCLETMLDTYYYEDSHCLVTRDGTTAKTVKEVHTAPWFSTSEQIRMVARTEENWYDNNYVIALPAGSVNCQRFILQHVGNMKSSKYLSAKVSTEIDPSIEVISVMGYEGNPVEMLNEVKKFNTYSASPNLVWAWIISYVNENRCHYELSVALDLLFQLAYWPNPTSKESALVLKNMVLSVSLPKFKPTRGYFPEFTRGEPFIGGLANGFNTELDIRSVRGGLVCGAVYNYIGILGAYSFAVSEHLEYAGAGLPFYELPKFKASAGEGGLFYNSASALFNLEIVTLVDVHLYPSVRFNGIGGLPDYGHYVKVNNQTGMQYIAQDDCPAPKGQFLTGGLVDGAVVANLPGLTHLAQTVRCLPLPELSEYELLTPEQVMNLAQVHRMLNYNLRLIIGTVGGKVADTWCPAHDWVVDSGEVWLQEKGQYCTVIGVNERATWPPNTDRGRSEYYSYAIRMYGAVVSKTTPTWLIKSGSPQTRLDYVFSPGAKRYKVLTYKVKPGAVVGRVLSVQPAEPKISPKDQDFRSVAERKQTDPQHGMDGPKDLVSSDEQCRTTRRGFTGQQSGGGTVANYGTSTNMPHPPAGAGHLQSYETTVQREDVSVHGERTVDVHEVDPGPKWTEDDGKNWDTIEQYP
nr:MAG: capsid protein [Totiviridae sp.]